MAKAIFEINSIYKKRTKTKQKQNPPSIKYCSPLLDGLSTSSNEGSLCVAQRQR